MTPDWLLTWLLRLSAAVLLLAVPTALLPTESMSTIHAALGLGTMPRAPLVDYLTRSASLLYGMHGGILLVLSFDVRRYAPVIRVVGYLTIAFGVSMFAVDLYAGLPWYWTAFEGLPTAVVGVLMAALARRLCPPAVQSADLTE